MGDYTLEYYSGCTIYIYIYIYIFYILNSSLGYTRFHWIRDKVRTKTFNVAWHPGKDNRADYFTKLHPTTHHVNMRRLYVSDNKALPRQSSRGVLDQAAHSSYIIGQAKAMITKAKDLKDL